MTKIKLNPTQVDTIPSKVEPRNSHLTKVKKVKKGRQTSEKPLFPHGDWVTIIIGVIILPQIDGMGHHLGHAGLFLLMLSLIARPIRRFSSVPLNYRRAIGIFAFAATLAHAIYASINVLDARWNTIWTMLSHHQWGLWAGILSLVLMTPAAITSFRFFQCKLGKRWRQIHLLTVPALSLAVLHTVLIGPHYMADLEMEIIDHLRSYGIVIMGLLVYLIRRGILNSGFRLNQWFTQIGKRLANSD